MQLVAILGNAFFRAQSITEKEVEIAKSTMLQDQEGLEFKIMTDEEFEQWLESQ